MIKLLPFILIPVILLGGLWYWRNLSLQQAVNITGLTQNSETVQNSDKSETGALAEVPKTLPKAAIEDRVKILEDAVNKLTPQLNNAKPSSSPSTSLDTRLTSLESAVTDLKARISVLEKATPASTSTSSSKYPLYIPLGAGGGPWSNSEWTTLNEYQATINPDNYSGYSSMQLEVNFRINEPVGTGSVRLYNATDSSAIVSQADTTSTTFGLQSSAAFKLPAGQKTYTIQVKSSSGKPLFVQTARVKVNF